MFSFEIMFEAYIILSFIEKVLNDNSYQLQISFFLRQILIDISQESIVLSTDKI